MIRCTVCEAISPASSHHCGSCGEPFGEPCNRCGVWRARARWSRKTVCGEDHELVCDLCHYDAHIQVQLPVTNELEELAMLADDGELSPSRNPFLKNLLQEELRRVGGAARERKNELCSLIAASEAESADDNRLNQVFEKYIAALPVAEGPQSGPQKYRLYVRWEAGRNQELAGWRDELAALESHPLDKQLVYNNARDRLMRLLDAEAREAGIFPGEHDSERSFEPVRRPVSRQVLEKPIRSISQEVSRHVPSDSCVWTTFIKLEKEEITGRKPLCIRKSGGEKIPVDNWVDLLFRTAEWLVEEGLLTEERCPVQVGNMTKRYLIHVASKHPGGREFGFPRQLSNGLYLEGQWDPRSVVRRCVQLLSKFGEDPAQFHVLLL